MGAAALNVLLEMRPFPSSRPVSTPSLKNGWFLTFCLCVAAPAVSAALRTPPPSPPLLRAAHRGREPPRCRGVVPTGAWPCASSRQRRGPSRGQRTCGHSGEPGAPTPRCPCPVHGHAQHPHLGGRGTRGQTSRTAVGDPAPSLPPGRELAKKRGALEGRRGRGRSLPETVPGRRECQVRGGRGRADGTPGGPPVPPRHLPRCRGAPPQCGGGHWKEVGFRQRPALAWPPRPPPLRAAPPHVRRAGAHPHGRSWGSSLHRGCAGWTRSGDLGVSEAACEGPEILTCQRAHAALLLLEGDQPSHRPPARCDGGPGSLACAPSHTAAPGAPKLGLKSLIRSL